MANPVNPTFQKANLGLPNAATPLLTTINPSQVTQAWMMFFLQMSNAIAGNGAALEGAIQGIDDIADLRSQTTSSFTAQIAYVAGYYAEGDGGEGIFIQGAAGSDNGGTLIVDASGRTWHRQTGGGPFSVLWWGAKSTPGATTFDNTTAFQGALDWCKSLGGGMVTVPVGIFYFTGILSVWSQCGLYGLTGGRGPDYFDPTNTVVAPMLLVTNGGGAFLTLEGAVQSATNVTGGAYAVGLMFYWPNQVSYTAATPTAYPSAILAYKGAYMERLNMINPYQGINLQGGRAYIKDCILGAYSNAIEIDSVYDYIWIDNIEVSVSYEYWPLGASYMAEPIDAWVKANRVNIRVNRCDAFKMTGITMLFGNIGFQFVDSGVSQPGSVTNSYGSVIGCDIDTTQVGIQMSTANTSGGGVQFIGLNNGSTSFSVQTLTGGSNPPLLLWQGGGNRSHGLGSGTTMSLAAGTVTARDVANFTPYGDMSAIQPAAPSSTFVQENFFPWPVQVFFEASSGSSSGITSIKINGVGVFNVQTYWILNPGDTIEIDYTGVTIAWKWFGL